MMSPGFEMRQQLLDDLVHGSPALTIIITRRGFFSMRNHFFDRMRADDLGAFGFVG